MEGKQTTIKAVRKALLDSFQSADLADTTMHGVIDKLVRITIDIGEDRQFCYDMNELQMRMLILEKSGIEAEVSLLFELEGRLCLAHRVPPKRTGGSPRWTVGPFSI